MSLARVRFVRILSEENDYNNTDTFRNPLF